VKENLDGEAILWAQRRISEKTHDKSTILHMSDGAPIDDSTLSINP